MKPNFQSNTMLIDGIGKKKVNLKKKEKKWVNWVNSSNSRLGLWDRDNSIKKKSNVEGLVT
jgi:hypothetical protein